MVKNIGMIPKYLKSLGAIVAGGLLFMNPVLSAEYFADTANGNDANNCQTQAMACKTISAAIAKAAASGDTVHVGEGVYIEGIRIEKSVIVIGAGADKTFIKSNFYGFWINASPTSVEIKNLSIEESQHNGIEVTSASVVVKIVDVRVTKSQRDGIWVDKGKVDILNVEISENARTGIHFNTLGSAINIVNTTISGNNVLNSTSYAGIGASAGPAIPLNNVTIVDNKFRNIEIYRNLQISNSVIHNHSGLGNCAITGTVTSLGHNLSGNNTCQLSHASDRINTDPKIESLGFNNGLTRTHASKNGSPLLNGGDNTTCAGTDQRGVPRPQNGTCDIGAYEQESDDGIMFPIKTKQGKTAIIAL